MIANFDSREDLYQNGAPTNMVEDAIPGKSPYENRERFVVDSEESSPRNEAPVYTSGVIKPSKYKPKKQFGTLGSHEDLSNY